MFVFRILCACVFKLFGLISRSMITGWYGKSVFSFSRNCHCSKVAIPFCILTNNVWQFLLLHILASIWFCQCLDFGHSNRYENTSFLMIYDVEHHFMFIFHLYFSSVKLPSNLSIFMDMFLVWHFFFPLVLRIWHLIAVSPSLFWW